MKFVPRQPASPASRSVSPNTTRFLRLQPADDARATAGAKFEPRPLPSFIPPAPKSGALRVRLRLDRQIATRPLPMIRQVLSAMEAESKIINPTAESVRSAAPIEDPSTIETPVALDEKAAPEKFGNSSDASSSPDVAVLPAPSEAGFVRPAIFEIPPVAETMRRAWFPPPPRQPTVPLWTPAVPLANRPADGPLLTAPPDSSAQRSSRPALSLRARRRDAAPESGDAALTPPPHLSRPAPTLESLSRPRPSLGGGFWFLLTLLILGLAAALGYFLVVPRLAGRFAAATSHVVPPRQVSFVVALRGNPVTELAVAGTVEPSRETALYARTTGYVRDWLADIGDKVKAGEVLAELDTPEVDHQLVEARAASDQAKASLALAQNEADRWAAMAAAHAVAQQDADAKIAARNEAQANVNAAEANVGRLVDLETFKEIRAPYAGTVTARNLEVGTLVGSGPGPAGSELFHLIETDPVRIFVNVPEAHATGIHAGVPAKLEVEDCPNRVFTGQVTRAAGALDAQHMLRTEIHIANADGALLPGAMASVHLLLVDPTPTLLVPASALVLTPAGASVVRIMPSDGREIVRLTAVKIGRDFGSQVEILSSLRDGDRLVTNPPSDLQDGMAVDARPLESTSAEAPALPPPHPSAPRA